jgi:hypothetical protein
MVLHVLQLVHDITSSTKVLLPVKTISKNLSACKSLRRGRRRDMEEKTEERNVSDRSADVVDVVYEVNSNSN